MSSVLLTHQQISISPDQNGDNRDDAVDNILAKVRHTLSPHEINQVWLIYKLCSRRAIAAHYRAQLEHACALIEAVKARNPPQITETAVAHAEELSSLEARKDALSYEALLVSASASRAFILMLSWRYGLE